MLKQQLRDSQAEVTQKLSELFQLKTQLRETRTELRNRDSQIEALKLVLQGTQRRRRASQTAHEDGKGAEDSPSAGATGIYTCLSLTCVYISSPVLFVHALMVKRNTTYISHTEAPQARVRVKVHLFTRHLTESKSMLFTLLESTFLHRKNLILRNLVAKGKYFKSTPDGTYQADMHEILREKQRK